MDSYKDTQFVTSLFLRPRLFFTLCGALFVFAALIAVAVFFISVRGAEEVMVPDVQNKEILPALVELQNKELYPRIQLRFSESAADKGRILEQDPKPGAIVKAGRRIRLVVSQGVLISAVGNYIGRNINDVRSELGALFGGSDIPLITIKSPLLYQFSQADPGTILQQDPSPGTGITGQTEVSLVVSRGTSAPNLEMPLLTGLPIQKALELLSKSGVRYEFLLRPVSSGAALNVVLSQKPAGGDAIPATQVAQITISGPQDDDILETEVAGLFSRRIQDNPYPMQTTLLALYPTGEKVTLADFKFRGNKFTWPYRVPKGTTLVLSLLNREIYRETVQ